MNKSIIVCGILGLAVAISARTSYTGYSGAPNSKGTCATDCHGGSGGTIKATGFPASYVPGQKYSITVSHDGGSKIAQFNASTRIGSGSKNAGTLAAGASTSVYNTSGETNGVHFSSTSQDNGTFNWTAPSEGTGSVKLYLAGLQGSKSGQNTSLELTSQEATTSAYVPLVNKNPVQYKVSIAEKSIIVSKEFAETPISVSLFSADGKKIRSKITDIGSGLVMQRPQKSGVYLLEIKNNGTKQYNRVVLP